MIDTEVKARTLLSPAKMSFHFRMKKERTPVLLSEVHSRSIEGVIPSVHYFVSFLLRQTKCYLTGDLGAVSSTQNTQGTELCYWTKFRA